jgi:hypothetical protein
VEAVEKRVSDPCLLFSLYGVLRFGGRPRHGRDCGLGYRAASLAPSLSHLLALNALLMRLAARIRLRHARHRRVRHSRRPRAQARAPGGLLRRRFGGDG